MFFTSFATDVCWFWFFISIDSRCSFVRPKIILLPAFKLKGYLPALKNGGLLPANISKSISSALCRVIFCALQDAPHAHIHVLSDRTICLLPVHIFKDISTNPPREEYSLLWKSISCHVLYPAISITSTIDNFFCTFRKKPMPKIVGSYFNSNNLFRNSP